MFADRIENMVEGVFDGLFRSVFRGKIQPLEMARQLTKRAEEERIISLSRVYVPNNFVIGLHPEDWAALEAVAPELEADFQRFVGEWVAEREYTVSGPVNVRMKTAERVPRGKMRITCAVHAAAIPEEQNPTIARPINLPEQAIGLLDGVEGPDGHRKFLLFPGRTLIGRGADCDIRLQNSEVSRHHAAIEPRDEDYWLVDLDSTNGSRLNGSDVEQAPLQSGDQLQLGESVFTLTFHDPEAMPPPTRPGSRIRRLEGPAPGSKSRSNGSAAAASGPTSAEAHALTRLPDAESDAEDVIEPAPALPAG